MTTKSGKAISSPLTSKRKRVTSSSAQDESESTKATDDKHRQVVFSKDVVSRDHVVKMVELFQSAKEDSTGKKLPLLFAEDARVEIQVAAIKLPKKEFKHLLKIQLPHSPLQPSASVCLIVKDLEKGIRVDHQRTLDHFKNLLRTKQCDQVSRVITFRELKVEYKEFESKTALCHQFDRILVDDRIVRLVPKFLGRSFYKRRKFPVCVNLTKTDLNAEIERALCETVLPLSNNGVSSQVTVGHTGQSGDELADCIMSVVDVVQRRYPGGWPNVRSIFLRKTNGKSFPLFLSTIDANEIDVNTVKPDVERPEVAWAEDELSTLPGAHIRVDALGNIQVKQVEPLAPEDMDLLDGGVLQTMKMNSRDRKKEAATEKQMNAKKVALEADVNKDEVGSKRKRDDVEEEQILEFSSDKEGDAECNSEDSAEGEEKIFKVATDSKIVKKKRSLNDEEENDVFDLSQDVKSNKVVQQKAKRKKLAGEQQPNSTEIPAEEGDDVADHLKSQNGKSLKNDAKEKNVDLNLNNGKETDTKPAKLAKKQKVPKKSIVLLRGEDRDSDSEISSDDEELNKESSKRERKNSIKSKNVLENETLSSDDDISVDDEELTDSECDSDVEVVRDLDSDDDDTDSDLSQTNEDE